LFKESDIFEDPAFKHDVQVVPDDDVPLNMERYLVPYNFLQLKDTNFSPINQTFPKEDVRNK